MTASRVLLATLILGLMLGALSSRAEEGPGKPLIAVTSIIEHPSLDAVRRGLEDGLASLDHDGVIEIRFESAEGSIARAKAIAAAFVAAEAAVIVAISTPSAQAVTAVSGEIPVVFAMVNDPEASDVLAPGGAVTGVRGGPPVAQHLDLLQAIVPQASRIGVVYDPDAQGVTPMIDGLRKVTHERKIDLLEARPTHQGAVAASLRDLGPLDAVYLPPGRAVAAAFEGLMEVAETRRIPVVAADPIAVHHGAIAALSPSFRDLGQQLARLVRRILDGEAAATIPIQAVQASRLYLNPEAAKAAGIDLPEALIARAKGIVAPVPMAVSGR